MPSRKSSLRKLAPAIATLSLLVLSPALALAAPGGAGLPWESSFETIEQSIQGIAPHLLVIAIVIAALALMFGESGGMSRKVVGIVVGGATIVGVTSVVSTLFEGGGGLLF
jgi:type IV secretory pathway VirB2 component (pilin)